MKWVIRTGKAIEWAWLIMWDTRSTIWHCTTALRQDCKLWIAVTEAVCAIGKCGKVLWCWAYLWSVSRAKWRHVQLKAWLTDEGSSTPGVALNCSRRGWWEENSLTFACSFVCTAFSMLECVCESVVCDGKTTGLHKCGYVQYVYYTCVCTSVCGKLLTWIYIYYKYLMKGRDTGHWYKSSNKLKCEERWRHEGMCSV